MVKSNMVNIQITPEQAMYIDSLKLQLLGTQSLGYNRYKFLGLLINAFQSAHETYNMNQDLRGFELDLRARLLNGNVVNKHTIELMPIPNKPIKQKEDPYVVGSAAMWLDKIGRSFGITDQRESRSQVLKIIVEAVMASKNIDFTQCLSLAEAKSMLEVTLQKDVVGKKILQMQVELNSLASMIQEGKHE